MKITEWGPLTWCFLHTLVEKIIDNHFKHAKNDLTEVIVLICGMIPCPICRQHALGYLKGNNINSCNTKESLKMY